MFFLLRFVSVPTPSSRSACSSRSARLSGHCSTIKNLAHTHRLLQRYCGVARSLCAIPDRLSNERRKHLYSDGVVFGADGSRLVRDDWAYAISLHRRVQIEYILGYRYLGRLLCFLCKTVNDEFTYCYELIAVARPSYAMNAIRAIQRLHRARRVRRYERSMRNFGLTLARASTRDRLTQTGTDAAMD